MKNILVIVFLLLMQLVQAQTAIGHEKARATAERFVLQQGKQVQQTLTLSEEIKSTETGQTNLFVFAIEPQGYVVVSAMNEVLAYSFTSSMPALGELPDHIAYWIGLYNEQTDYLLQYPDRIKKPERQQHSVGPLLTSVWGQGCYHNLACPYDFYGPCYHAEAGCVALAIAQIMYYHKLPLKGNGSMTYNCPSYGILSADFGNTTYQWENMFDTVKQINYDVANLISHCGISVRMNYGTNLSVSSITAALNALQEFFYYPFSTLSIRSDCTEEDWTALIRQNIENQRPVYYEGKSDLGIHAFVCDGYDSNGLFHFNFGWDGVADGFYTINSPYGFSVNQSCIHNIIPLANFPIQSDSHGIIYVTPDGNGDGSSWENATSDLQTAIYKSNVDKTTIWVKEGSYTKASSDGHAFNVFGDCLIYGGFKGDEPYDYDLSLRDFETHPCILDGNHTDGVLKVQFAANPVLIDGFTIQNGEAYKGGGILAKCQTHIKNCKFRFNHSRSNGGGLSLQPASSGVSVIENCKFYGNEANTYGGAVYDNGTTTYLHCQFHNNLAQKNGGGLAIIQQGATLWNCLINNNTAETGGGCYLKAGGKLFNCTIVKNEAQIEYGGVYVAPLSSQGEIRNCIIWGNISVGENVQIGPQETYLDCAVEGDRSGANYNYNADQDNDGEAPRFYVRFRNANVVAGVAGQDGDWRLQPNSLCINRGMTLQDQPSTDLDGNPRCRHGRIDFGVYESNTATNFINTYYCENDPYYYQDSLLSESGTYAFFHNGDTYDSLVVVQMQSPPPSVFLSESICEDSFYDFFGTLINTTGIYTTTIDCKTYQLDLTVHPSDSVSMEAEICEGETYDFFGESLCETGHYSTVKDCTTYELDLTVTPNPIITLEKTICEGETYDFFGTPLRESGHYSKAHNCKTYELDLTVCPLPPLRCSNDTLIEYGNQVQLTAYGADAYLWSTGETTASIIVSPKEGKTYSVKGYSQNKLCDKTVSVTVKVKNEEGKVTMFPNPASDMVEINISFIDEVEVFNLLGERICHIKANREAVKLDVSDYPAGIYIVQVKQLKNLYFEKLVVGH